MENTTTLILSNPEKELCNQVLRKTYHWNNLLFASVDFTWKIVLKVSYNKVEMSSARHSPATQKNPKTKSKTLSRKLSHRKGNFGQLYLMTRDKEVPGRFHGLESVRHKGSEKYFLMTAFLSSPPLYLSPLSFGIAFLHISPFFPLLFPTFLV